MKVLFSSIQYRWAAFGSGTINRSIQSLLFTILNLTHLIVSSNLVLFIVLVFIAVQLFNCLNKRVNFLLIDYNSGLINDSGLAVRLEKWKNHHILVYQFVRWINHCYDPIIFFAICHGFMTIVGYSFGVVEAFTPSMNDILKIPFVKIFY